MGGFDAATHQEIAGTSGGSRSGHGRIFPIGMFYHPFPCYAGSMPEYTPGAERPATSNNVSGPWNPMLDRRDFPEEQNTSRRRTAQARANRTMWLRPELGGSG